MLAKFVNAINTTIRLSNDDRSIFYQIYKTQLESGVRSQRIFEMLCTSVQISPEITILAESALQSIHDGGTATEGLVESNFLPYEDGLLLVGGEQKDTLKEVLGYLIDRGADGHTFMGKVVLPNLYYLSISGVLLFVSTKIEGLLVAFKGLVDYSENPAYLLSVWSNTYLLPLVLVIGAVIAGGYFLSYHTYGGLRRFVPFFAKDIQLQLGAKFSAVASVYSTIGATPVEILNDCEEIFGGSGFMKGAFAYVREQHEGEGFSFTNAMAESVFLPEIGAVLSSMAPDESRAAMPAAYTAVNKLQVILLTKRHRQAKMMLQLILLSVAGYLLIILITGLYSLFDF